MKQLLLIATLLLGCTSPRGVWHRNDHDVLEAALSDQHLTQLLVDPTATILLPNASAPAIDQTSGQPYFFALSDQLEKQLAPFREQLRSRNRTARPLPPHLASPLPISGCAAIQGRSDVRQFVWVSMPAYDKTGNRAAVAVVMHLNKPCCGSGYIALLSKTASGWRVDDHTAEWIE